MEKKIVLAIVIIVIIASFIVIELSRSRGAHDESHGYTMTYPAQHQDETFELGPNSHRDYSLWSKGQYHIAISASGAVDIEAYSREELVTKKTDIINTTLDFFNESQEVTVRIVNRAWLHSRTVRIVIDKEYYEEWISS